LYAIGVGFHPDDPDWAEVMAESGRIHSHFSNRVNFRREASRSHSLYRILAGADICVMSTECPFPIPLGYLGIALHTFLDFEPNQRLLTSSWAPQLRELVTPGSFSDKALQEMIEKPGKILTWQFLSSVESDFDHVKYPRELNLGR
jgi:hypothetical protein